jgi:hypothetical protein
MPPAAAGAAASGGGGGKRRKVSRAAIPDEAEPAKQPSTSGRAEEAAPAYGPAHGLHPLGLRSRPGCPFISYLGIKEHAARPGQQPGVQHGPALFVAGLPLGFGQADVAELFGCFGDVEQVVLHSAKVRHVGPGMRAQQAQSRRPPLSQTRARQL